MIKAENIIIERYSDHKYFVKSYGDFDLKIWTKSDILDFLKERLVDEDAEVDYSDLEFKGLLQTK